VVRFIRGNAGRRRAFVNRGTATICGTAAIDAPCVFPQGFDLRQIDDVKFPNKPAWTPRFYQRAQSQIIQPTNHSIKQSNQHENEIVI
jgi:hypothetical protein